MYTDSELSRRLVPEYSDGTYLPAGVERPPPILVSDQTMKGVTGFASDARDKRTAFFIFFGNDSHFNTFIHVTNTSHSIQVSRLLRRCWTLRGLVVPQSI